MQGPRILPNPSLLISIGLGGQQGYFFLCDWFLGRRHSHPQRSSDQREFCSSSSPAHSHITQAWALGETKTQHNFSHLFFCQHPPGTIFIPWHRNLQDIQLFKVFYQVSLRYIGLVISPVSGRWILSQSGQCGGKGLIQDLRGLSMASGFGV